MGLLGLLGLVGLVGLAGLAGLQESLGGGGGAMFQMRCEWFLEAFWRASGVEVGGISHKEGAFRSFGLDMVSAAQTHRSQGGFEGSAWPAQRM